MASVSGRVEELSHDHKPNNEQETKRIEAAGGWVEFNRVNGMHGIASENFCRCFDFAVKAGRNAAQLRDITLAMWQQHFIIITGSALEALRLCAI